LLIKYSREVDSVTLFSCLTITKSIVASEGSHKMQQELQNVYKNVSKVHEKLVTYLFNCFLNPKTVATITKQIKR